MEKEIKVTPQTTRIVRRILRERIIALKDNLRYAERRAQSDSLSKSVYLQSYKDAVKYARRELRQAVAAFKDIPPNYKRTK